MRKQLGPAPRNSFDAVTVRYTDTLEGDSAYETAVKNGFVGTEEQWLDSLEGDQGIPGPGSPFLIVTPEEYAAMPTPRPANVLYVLR